MGTTPKLHLPYPEITEPADVPADIKELALALDNVGAVGVTSLPASPADGTLVALQTAAMLALEARWILRWSASRSRWLPEGGTPMITAPPTAVIQSPATSVVLPFSPTVQLTLPVSGKYVLEFGFDWVLPVSSPAGAMFCAAPQGGGIPALPANPTGSSTPQHMLFGHGNGTSAGFYSWRPGLTKSIVWDVVAPLVLTLMSSFNTWGTGALTAPRLQATPLALLGA